jgi:GPH family glycoside/pentoside/hexuronide:cation symporter
VIGTPLLILSFVMFFNVPEIVSSDPGRLFIYMLLLYLMTGTLDSLINANYGALFPELFRSDKDRAKTNAIRQACQLVAMVISIALTPMITSAIGYRLTSLIYGVIALAVILYCAFGCHEDMSYEVSAKPNFWKSLVDLVRNGRFWIYGITGAFYSAASALLLQAVSFYVKYSLSLESGQTTILLASVFAVALISILIWTLISRKVDVMRIWRLGFLIMGLSFVPLFFTQTLLQALPFVAAVGFGMAACLITMDCIGAKIIDDDYQKHHIKREGMMTSLVGMLNRLNGLYSSLAFFVVSESFGFVNGDNPGPSPDIASRVLMCVFPFAAMMIAYIMSHFLHFREADNAVSDTERG